MSVIVWLPWVCTAIVIILILAPIVIDAIKKDRDKKQK